MFGPHTKKLTYHLLLMAKLRLLRPIALHLNINHHFLPPECGNNVALHKSVDVSNNMPILTCHFQDHGSNNWNPLLLLS